MVPHDLRQVQDPASRRRRCAARSRVAPARRRRPAPRARQPDRDRPARGLRGRRRRPRLLLGRGEDVLGGAGRLVDVGRLRRRRHAEPHATRRCAPDAPATPRSCASSSIPSTVSFQELLQVFWENHDPTQGMRQGNDRGSQYRSIILTTTPDQQKLAEESRDHYQEKMTAAGYGQITTAIQPLERVLLRRGLPPAVPRQEPVRLLPAARHRDQVRLGVSLWARRRSGRSRGTPG